MKSGKLAVRTLLEAGRNLSDLLVLIEVGPRLESIDAADGLGREILRRIKTARKLLQDGAAECAVASGIPMSEVVDAFCPGPKRAR